MPQVDVLIVGAGPTGLIIALWLHRQGVSIRIIDEAAGPAPDSRAFVIHARILELYRQLDLTDDLLAAGYKLPATNVWVNGQHRAHISLRDFGRELTAYPYMLTLPQNDHERLLERRLNSLGIFVERRTNLQQFEDHGSSIIAALRRGDDESEMTCEAAYIVGCDGAHSIVRRDIGAKYEGDAYAPLFYVADIDADEQDSPLFNGEGHLRFVDDTFNLVLPYAQERRVRLVGTIMPKENEHQEVELSTPHPDITFEDVLPDIRKASSIGIAKVRWFSTYRSHHRVASAFRRNRAFLVGDAAHIHSPIGGQGMNTGIMDAINLAWKLATVLRQPSMTDDAKNNFLDSYEAERRPFALTVVGATDHGFTVLTGSGFLPHLLRSWIIPYVAPLATKFQSVRTEIFRRGSQLVCTYRGSSLNQLVQGTSVVQPGDRLPWATTDQGDNFSTLHDICWHIHVYGDRWPGLAEWCHKSNVQLTVFAWDAHYGQLGFKKDAVYLLRPDQYIAGIFEGDAIESQLDEYFSSRGVAC
ncbi:uncharacterized protein N7459_000607 [Penicillium hispanicum]|uniref:uncharacterized protein n=1 Tax=Penicillium hispanicum TaxID=1080232 RepID=UPI0025421196|nr:uncharacterized protein N7459_000607 [Penicillium hispanicum]KAJ5594399.1 hypothetical protein N7459_000607 [Penicillium hispanicum]